MSDEVELDSLGRPKGKFDRSITVDKNPFRRKKGLNQIYKQVREKNPMGPLPIELIAYVKDLWARKYGWDKITELVRAKFIAFSKIETSRLRAIYNHNKDSFIQARMEFETSFQETFNEEREHLFTTTLSAEIEIARALGEQVEKLTKALDMVDILDEPKKYATILGALSKAQEKLAELTNTARFRRLEENRMILNQKKEIEGLPDKEKEEKETSVNIIGSDET